MRFRRPTIVLLVIGLVFVVSGCDWSMYAFGPAHTSYNPVETTIGVGNVSTLQEAWTAVLGLPHGGSATPVVSRGVVYATSSASPFELEAFNARGAAGCSGAPTTCTPLWTAFTISGADSVQVANRLVYLTTRAGRLSVFDAAGVKGCAGVPKTCTPLWTANGLLATSSLDLHPAITARFVYAQVGSGVSAFDAAGVNGCSGTPKICHPLWSVLGGSPAVLGAVLYVARHSGTFEVGAYDSAGVRKCTGTPKTCAPLWVGRTANHGDILNYATEPTVSNGVVWFGIRSGDERSGGGALVGFDQAAHQGCAGTPKICSPIWNAPTGGVVYPAGVANNVVYALEYSYSNFAATKLYRLSAFDLVACHTPTVSCSPLWTASLAAMPQGLAVANGLVYVTTWDDRQIAAYDATGTNGCAGSPVVCTPVWQTTVSGAPTPPVIANGFVYSGSSDDNILHAYTLP